MGCWVAVLTKNGMDCRQQHLGLSLSQYPRNRRPLYYSQDSLLGGRD